MKIQCDVCSANEASVYCSADEAALCAACDHRVHDANKLASKHERFSLLQPSDKQFPICDICQEKIAFVFCQQDRAILCKDCDGSVHKSNEHTRSHSRFLLTGIKLGKELESRSKPSKRSKSDVSQMYQPTPLVELTSLNNNIGGSATSISEYLIETLPGWHVEDFLDATSPLPFGFPKIDDLCDFERNLDYFSSGNMESWVPIQPQISPYVNGKTGATTNMDFSSSNKKKWSDDGFTVPQISPPSTTSLKRSRLLC